MTWIALLVAVLFAILGLVCIFTVAIGLPGSWILLGLALLIELSDSLYLPAGDQQTFNWWLLLACVMLATIGEVLEFFAGLFGAKKAGSSKKGMIGSLLGGLAGAFLGMGIPIPIVGSLIGVLLGTFAGAILGEMLADESKAVKETLRPATGATIGRILGTLAKIPVALTIWIALSLAAFF